MNPDVLSQLGLGGALAVAILWIVLIKRKNGNGNGHMTAEDKMYVANTIRTELAPMRSTLHDINGHLHTIQVLQEVRRQGGG